MKREMLSANDWQGRTFGGPPIAEPLTCDDLWTDQECPNCRHPLSSHSVDLGCHVGWEQSCAHADGCTCPLSLALQHNPKRETDVPDRAPSKVASIFAAPAAAVNPDGSETT